MQVHRLTSGERGCSLTYVVHRFVLKFATFNGACPMVDYVGRLQPVFSVHVVTHDEVGCPFVFVVYPELYLSVFSRFHMLMNDPFQSSFVLFVR